MLTGLAGLVWVVFWAILLTARPRGPSLALARASLPTFASRANPSACANLADRRETIRRGEAGADASAEFLGARGRAISLRAGLATLHLLDPVLLGHRAPPRPANRSPTSPGSPSSPPTSASPLRRACSLHFSSGRGLTVFTARKAAVTVARDDDVVHRLHRPAPQTTGTAIALFFDRRLRAPGDLLTRC